MRRVIVLYQGKNEGIKFRIYAAFIIFIWSVVSTTWLKLLQNYLNRKNSNSTKESNNEIFIKEVMQTWWKMRQHSKD